MTVPYILKRSRKRRKTISLQISSKSEIIVSAPYFTPGSEINRFIKEKQIWINKAIQKQETTRQEIRKKEYVTEEEFYYLGETYPLEIFWDQNLPAGLVFWGNRFYLNCREDEAKGKQYFLKWYKSKAQEYFSKRIDFLSNHLQLKPRKLRITSAQQRWGSCSEENNIALSLHLVMAPPPVIDYVIIHELMHIKEKNHSAKFWKLVEFVMPEYKKNRQWLKDNGLKFAL
jgi:predicted metal-dependent hydrolase